MPGSAGDVGKVSSPHRRRLTTANTSRKVAVCLRYQADTRNRDVPIRVQCSRHPSATRLERPKSKGVVRSMARSDQWHCVSMRHQGTTFLKRHFQTPARNFVADDLCCRLGGIGGTDGGWRGRLPKGSRVRTRADRQGIVSIAVPKAVPVVYRTIKDP